MNLPRRRSPKLRFFPIRRVACLLAAFALGASDVQQPAVTSYAERPEAQAFITDMVRQYGFEAETLKNLLGRAVFLGEVSRLVAPPPVPIQRSWRVYRSRFVEPLRIKAGVTFWKEHEATLARAEKDFGVPAEILVGIIGVETLYGRQMGRFPILDVLATLAFDYPDTPNKAGRSELFRSELEAFLIWCRDTQQDATTFTGSYAAAIGIPQFLPSSIRAHAVDFDGDGQIDLRGSAEDAIGSVARYLKDKGWQPGRPTFWRPVRTPTALKALAERADGSPDLKWSMDELLAAGILPAHLKTPKQQRAFRASEKATPVVLVDLPSPDRPTDYVLGLTNFYVITRYNRSFFYAMAVADLGQAVKTARKRK
jgi:membrane-bound lytic murein transglycosylase B